MADRRGEVITSSDQISVGDVFIYTFLAENRFSLMLVTGTEYSRVQAEFYRGEVHIITELLGTVFSLTSYHRFIRASEEDWALAVLEGAWQP